MSITVLNGLPAHVLFVHFVIVLIPLSALAILVCAIWPQASRRFGLVLPALALVTLASVPLATQAGEWLEEHVPSNPLVHEHAELGDGLLPWAIGLFVVSVVVWWIARGAESTPSTGPTWLASTPFRVAISVLAFAIATGAVVDVYRIGDSGTRAAWQDRYSSSATR
ncbi:MAG: DUF2231 domain-containing protein [Streptosporangiaceae bacterium]